jgi:hypothetical protein
LRIDTSGNVLVTSPAGLGYGTGAGGTVTQATSKSTAVTLIKPCGRITMNNEALAAGASVQFTINNSLIGTYDIVLLTINFNGRYSIRVVATGSGTVAVVLTNESAVSLSDAVAFNFSIIKGTT